MPEDRVSEVRIETLVLTNSNARVSEERQEVLIITPSVTRLSEQRIEVAVQNAYPIAQSPMRVAGIIGG